MAAICDLPIEMRLEILVKLDLHELAVNSSKTCHQWRDDIAQHILAHKILVLVYYEELDYTEVVDLKSGKIFSMAPLGTATFGATGGLLDGLTVICGGVNDNEIHGGHGRLF